MTTLSYDQGYHDAVQCMVGAFGGTLAAGVVLTIVFVVSAWIHGRNRDAD